MRPSFLTRLVNGPLYDPIVYCRLLNENRAVMFDCGRFRTLANRELLQLEAIFISHTHMDHFMGMDEVLRVILHRNQALHVFGPEGIHRRMLAKLQAYTWNLTAAYGLEIHIHEVREQTIHSLTARADKEFAVISEQQASREDACIYATPRFSVQAVVLDHNIACLGFVLQENMHVNIRADALAARGLIPGPWLGRFKELALRGAQGEVAVETSHGRRIMSSADLIKDLVLLTPGQKITYLSDLRCSEENLAKIIPLAQDPDLLFIEAFYLDELREEALARGHLTALQAGLLARRLRARQVAPMHISPRHHNQVEQILAEVAAGQAES